ncbi:hypothetical protein R6V09_17965 [Streptomyces sp. W16]|uniref:hypothetical protein n=1 Tax=Streptomyces sp. W16 TaxID=3076631 RepID=UPI00295B7E5D|nr:hypothetical protein [Streptomyces sp. W16]MDV9171992.1 hypothetical protein [Streptomyces sp. W16]
MAEQNLVSDLSEWLLGRGFVMTEDRQVGGFEDILLRFAGEGCEVNLVRQRGKWGITLAPPGGEPKLYPQIWRYYLDSVPLQETLAGRAESFESEVSFVRDRLDEVIVAVQSDRNVGDRLVGINWAIVKDRLGLDPGMPRPGQPGFGNS